MRRYPIQAKGTFCLSLALLVGCGDAAVPQGHGDAARPDATVTDAAPAIMDAAPLPDACPCRAPGIASRIEFASHANFLYSGYGLGNACRAEPSEGQLSADGELMGASAALETGIHEHRAWLRWAGVLWRDIFPQAGQEPRTFLSWLGSWNTEVPDDEHRIITTVTCLLPDATSEQCARNAWISYAHRTDVLTPQGQIDLRASCSEGVLVGGGCTANGFNNYDIALLRSGFAPDNRDEWLCSFTSQYDTESTEVMALALCLHEEPLPAECGCCPSLADSLTVKQETEPLRFGANRLQVQCNPGQFLVLGNCMIDVPSAADVADVQMFRFGFPPTAEHPDGDHATWGCSWYNPTGNTPQAIATAVCLPAE